MLVQPFALQRIGRQRLGLQQEGGVGGHLDVPHADLFQELARAALPHRHRVHAVQGVPHQRARRRILQRPRAHRVDQHRDVVLLRDLDLSEIDRHRLVVEDAPAAQDHEVEPGNLRPDLVAREIAHRDGLLDLVARRGVLGVTREHGDLAGHRGPQLRHHGLQDRLVAQVHAAVRARDADPVHPVRRGSGHDHIRPTTPVPQRATTMTRVVTGFRREERREERRRSVGTSRRPPEGISGRPRRSGAPAPPDRGGTRLASSSRS